MTTRATEPKRGGSGGHVYIGLIVGVADDSIATAGGNRGIFGFKKRKAGDWCRKWKYTQ